MWIKNIWCIYIMDYSPIRKNEAVPFPTNIIEIGRGHVKQNNKKVKDMQQLSHSHMPYKEGRKVH